MTPERSRVARKLPPLVRRRRRAPPGSPPGTLVADPSALPPTVRFVGYGPEEIDERAVADVAELEALAGKWPVTWINVDGLGDLDLIRRLAAMFGIHRLALEDVVNVHQRPKVEEYEDHAYIVARMIHAGDGPTSEQISLFLGKDFLLTFQVRPGDCFDAVRERLRGRRGQIRERGADYLAYALVDAVVDGYFPVLEAYGEQLEALESAVVDDPQPDHGAAIHDMKRDLLALRRSIWPQREMLSALSREPSPYFTDQTRVYLRDCYDHAIQLLDVVETYREIASGLIDVYLSSASARMGEVMKVLTIIATLFIPLTFIAGVYGMNFRPETSPWNMPELGWYWGYPAALALMAAVAVGLLVAFRRMGWLGRRRR